MHSTVSRRLRALVMGLALAMLSAGCQTLSYYSHAALGQWRVLSNRQDVESLMAELEPRRHEDPAAAALYDRLALSQAVVDFAASNLHLEVGRRYRTYVDLERPAVAWNVFAAPPLSLEPERWCYPVVGCAPYRGYFDQTYAQRRAAALQQQGLETYVGRVAAYSTLGWFADPLLSTFIGWPEYDLATLLFHELAHGQVWVTGDVAFNESFATFVGRQGLIEWLRRQGREAELEGHRDLAVDRRRLVGLLMHTRSALRDVYRSDLDPTAKLEAKGRILDATATCYADMRDWLGAGRFDGLMTGLDNARLVSVATYENLVPGFAAMFDQVGGDWRAFYERVRAMAELEVPQRRAALARLRNQQIAERGDDQRTDQVQCQALASHRLDGEPSS